MRKNRVGILDSLSLVENEVFEVQPHQVFLLLHAHLVSCQHNIEVLLLQLLSQPLLLLGCSVELEHPERRDPPADFSLPVA